MQQKHVCACACVHAPGKTAQTYNPSTRARGTAQIQGQPSPHSELQKSQDYIVRHY